MTAHKNRRKELVLKIMTGHIYHKEILKDIQSQEEASAEKYENSIF